jgi:hypothetical protein
MKQPRRIDAPITQDPENVLNLINTFARTLTVVRTEATMALNDIVRSYQFQTKEIQRILENYEILANRLEQIRALLPKDVTIREKALPAPKKNASQAQKRPAALLKEQTRGHGALLAKT